MYKNSEISNKADHETRQRLIGGYKKSCENLLEFSTRNPEDKNSQNFKQLVSLKERALDKLYSYQPALRKLYPDKNDFPIFDGDNIRMVDIGNILSVETDVFAEQSNSFLTSIYCSFYIAKK